MDFEGKEALDYMWTALRSAFPEPRERTAFALYWADRWGIHWNQDQFDGRVRWWQTHVSDDDIVSDEDCHVTFGRERYRRMADAAITALQ